MENCDIKEYDKMNWLYNALYGDISTEQLQHLDHIEILKELLQSYGNKEISILDSACGNGVQATALALNGYHVTATDISGEMIKLAKELAKKHNIELKTSVNCWLELPGLFQSQFDIVLNIGNSIVHSLNSTTRESDLSALIQVLKKEGTLVIETRNWEKIIAENNSFTVYDKVSYLNKSYVPMYHWMLNGMENEAKVEILLQEIWENNHVELYESTLNFTPFSHQMLIDTMKKLGLTITKDTYDKECDRYMVYGKKS